MQSWGGRRGAREPARRQLLALRLERLLPLLGRQQQRQAWLAEVWALRGQVMSAVLTLSLTLTLALALALTLTLTLTLSLSLSLSLTLTR